MKRLIAPQHSSIHLHDQKVEALRRVTGGELKKTKLLNFGIIGYGKMGRVRHETVETFSDCKVTHVYDPNLKAPFPEVTIAEDYRDIVNDDNLDAVFICVPNYLICPLVKEGLAAGKHIFCEKPPGINASEVIEMMEVEQISGRKLMFGFNHRHHESMQYAKHIIDSRELGDILWMRGRYGKSVDENYSKTWRAKRANAGGGIFLDQGIHMLDLFLMMVDNFDEVKAYVSNLYWSLDVEDNVFAIFKNKKGQVASLHSTMTQWRHLFALEIFLEKGHIVVNGLLTSSGAYGQEQLSIARNEGSGPSVSWNGEERRIYNINTSWVNEIQMFLDCIEQDKEIPIGNSRDALKLMTLVDKVYAQA